MDIFPLDLMHKSNTASLRYEERTNDDFFKLVLKRYMLILVLVFKTNDL